MMAPVVRRLGAERHRDRHLRHHGRAAAADQAPVDQQHAAAGAGGLDRGIHAGRAGADHQHVGFDPHRLGHGGSCAHAANLNPPANSKPTQIPPEGLRRSYRPARKSAVRNSRVRSAKMLPAPSSGSSRQNALRHFGRHRARASGRSSDRQTRAVLRRSGGGRARPPVWGCPPSPRGRSADKRWCGTPHPVACLTAKPVPSAEGNSRPITRAGAPIGAPPRRFSLVLETAFWKRTGAPMRERP